MHLDTDAYLAIGGLVAILVITAGLLTFVLSRKG